MDMDKAIKESFHWLISELWEVNVLADNGMYDVIPDKLEPIIEFLKSTGISEEIMALEKDLDYNSLIKFFTEFFS